MAEFSIIERFCQGIGAQHTETQIGVGDDAAVVSIPFGMELAISVDTLVVGVHFLPDVEPKKIAQKLCAVNLSDMAAMGAEPKWATLTLTLPDYDDPWLTEFSAALDTMLSRYGVQLIGGDTTQGELNLSMQIMGLLVKSKVLTRNGAKLGDDVYVSNCIGDAALALQSIKSPENRLYDGLSKLTLLNALEQPEPQVHLGQRLLTLANACIDISDGLVADLSHIAKQSRVSIEIEADRVPLSAQYLRYVANGGSVDLALTGGDDYQLAFSAPIEYRERLQMLAETLVTPLSRIGQVIAEAEEPIILTKGDEPYPLSSNSGYQHFGVSKHE